MIANLSIPFRMWRTNRMAIGCGLFYIAIFCYAMHDHIMWQSLNVWMGIAALPLLATITQTGKAAYRYGWLALLATLLCMVLPVKTFLYLSVSFAMLFVIESFWGRTSLLLPVVIGMLSPVFQYMANVFSFPVRLWLSGIAGRLLQAAGTNTVVKGNMICQGDREFSVDPACMGLNMLVTSLLLQVLLVAVYSKQYKKEIRWWQLFLLLGFVTILNILANLMRIICLVQFNLLPGTPLHELAGIIALIVYVIIPAVLMTRWVIKRWAKDQTDHSPVAMSTPGFKGTAMHLVLAIAMLVAAHAAVQRDNTIHNISGNLPVAEGYKVSRVDGDVIKLEHSNAFIYVKPIEGFYSSDHHPMICWRGSGYEFRQVEAQQLNGIAVYTGLLQNGKDILYTAWWYDSGANQTTEQLEWRWDALKNAQHYAVVNVTAASRKELEEEIRAMQQEQLSRKVLQQL